MMLQLLMAVAFITAAVAADSRTTDAGETFFQDDMVTLSEIGSIRNAVKQGLKYFKWEKVDGKVVIPYTFDPAFPDDHKKAVQEASKDNAASTCIRSVERTNQPTNLTFFRGSGCYSDVGNRRKPEQKIFLDYGCGSKRTATHDMIHAIGFWHEQRRPDRDQFVTILWDNISPGNKDQFDICPKDFCELRPFPYDVGSIMHYEATAFGNGKTTIVPNQQGTTLGQRVVCSRYQEIYKLYEC